jgi:hypothetical protein
MIDTLDDLRTEAATGQRWLGARLDAGSTVVGDNGSTVAGAA